MPLDRLNQMRSRRIGVMPACDGGAIVLILLI
jgi:hypothetical protein